MIRLWHRWFDDGTFWCYFGWVILKYWHGKWIKSHIWLVCYLCRFNRLWKFQFSPILVIFVDMSMLYLQDDWYLRVGAPLMIPTFLMAMSIVQFGCFKPAVYRIPQSFITHFPPFIGGRSFKTAYMFVVFPFLAFFFGSSELFLISRQNHLILTDIKLNTKHLQTPRQKFAAPISAWVFLSDLRRYPPKYPKSWHWLNDHGWWFLADLRDEVCLDEFRGRIPRLTAPKNLAILRPSICSWSSKHT